MNGTGTDGINLSAICAGLLAMILIYAVTALLPKISSAADRLLEKIIPPPEDKKPPDEGEYKVYDIYEGEINLIKTSNDAEGADENGKRQ